MKDRWTQLKFVWEYATHLQTDNNPPLELIFKFVDTLDKKDTKQHIKNFSKLAVSEKVYKQKLPVRLQVKENDYPVDSFGAKFKEWSSDEGHIVDLFQLSLVPYRATRRKNTKFNNYAEATMLQHDLIHFFNDYDTSPIGEVAVLSFNLAQEWRRSYATILFASFLMSIRNTFIPSKYPKDTPFLTKLKYSPIEVFLRVVFESWLRGKKSKWFLSIDWESKLMKPYDEVAAELNLSTKPTYWKKIQPIWRKALIQYKRYAKKHGAAINGTKI